MMFHIPPLWHDDVPALYMLGRVMSARTGKMYLDLVEKQQHVTSVMRQRVELDVRRRVPRERDRPRGAGRA